MTSLIPKLSSPIPVKSARKVSIRRVGVSVCLLVVLIAVAFVVSLVIATEADSDSYKYSGRNYCGGDLYWEIENGTELHINYEHDGYKKDLYMDDFPETGGPWGKDITKVVFKYEVKSIGKNAFKDCTKLESVEYPFWLESIGDHAFEGCTKLEQFGFREGFAALSVIGDYAYSGCTGLTRLEISNPIQTIGKGAFSGCNGISRLLICDSTITIGDWAFDGCTRIPLVEIPNKVQTIGNYAFNNCTGIINLAIGESVTSIGDYAFYGCSGVNKLRIPNSVQTIGISAFTGCTRIAGVLNIGNSVTSIGECAFSYLTRITGVTIGDSVTSIGGGAFYACNSLNTVYYNASGLTLNPGDDCWPLANDILFVDANGGHVAGSAMDPDKKAFPRVADSILLDGFIRYSTEKDGTGTTYMPGDDYEFEGKQTVYAIWGAKCGDSLYWNLDGNELMISGRGDMYDHDIAGRIGPWGTDITGVSFYNVPNTEGITSIGNWAFRDCSGLTSVTIPDSVKSIGDGAFEHCTGLTSVTIGDSVTSIGRMAFNCPLLNTVYYNASDLDTNANCWPLANDILFIVGCKVGHITGSGMDWANMTFPSTDDFKFRLHGDDEFVGYNTSMDGTGTFYMPGDDYRLSGKQVVYAIWLAKCGNNLSWSLDGNNLTITGYGDMYNYSYGYGSPSDPPWGTGIRSVTLSDGITSIGRDAFFHCFELTSVTIPDSVTFIGDRAFYGCSNLASVTIGSSVTSIGEQAFYECSNLASVTIPDLVQTIGAAAFYRTGLTSVTIPDYVNYIGHYAFQESKMVSVVIGDHVKTIKAWVFSRCDNLRSITFPDTDCHIELLDCFTGMKFYLDGKEVSTWDDVRGKTFTGNGDKKFYYHEVHTVTFDANVGSCDTESMPTDIDGKLSSLPTATCDGLTFTGWYTKKSGGKGIDLNTIFNADITVYARWAEEGDDGDIHWLIKKDTLILSKKYDAASGDMRDYTDNKRPNWEGKYWEAVTKVTIEKGVTSIGDYAFYGCTGLKRLTGASTITYIGDYAFCGCTGLKDFSTGSYCVTYIGDYAYSGCTNLCGTLGTPDTVTYIGEGAYKGCTGLTIVNISKSVETISNSLFEGCSRLYSVKIPDSVTSIGDHAFKGCTDLNEATIGKSVETISDSAFEGCSSLYSVKIPDSVTSIGDYAFKHCSSLARVTIGSSVTSIGDEAFNSSGLTGALIIPNSVTSIGRWAFYGCSGLTSLTIGSSVTSIGDEAFSGCNSVNVVYYNASSLILDTDAYYWPWAEDVSRDFLFIVGNGGCVTGGAVKDGKFPSDVRFEPPEGKEFEMFNTSIKGPGTVYKPGYDYVLKGRKTLFAIWTDASGNDLTWSDKNLTIAGYGEMYGYGDSGGCGAQISRA